MSYPEHKYFVSFIQQRISESDIGCPEENIESPIMSHFTSVSIVIHIPIKIDKSSKTIILSKLPKIRYFVSTKPVV